MSKSNYEIISNEKARQSTESKTSNPRESSPFYHENAFDKLTDYSRSSRENGNRRRYNSNSSSNYSSSAPRKNSSSYYEKQSSSSSSKYYRNSPQRSRNHSKKRSRRRFHYSKSRSPSPKSRSNSCRRRRRSSPSFKNYKLLSNQKYDKCSNSHEMNSSTTTTRSTVKEENSWNGSVNRVSLNSVVALRIHRQFENTLFQPTSFLMRDFSLTNIFTLENEELEEAFLAKQRELQSQASPDVLSECQFGFLSTTSPDLLKQVANEGLSTTLCPNNLLGHCVSGVHLSFHADICLRQAAEEASGCKSIFLLMFKFMFGWKHQVAASDGFFLLAPTPHRNSHVNREIVSPDLHLLEQYKRSLVYLYEFKDQYFHPVIRPRLCCPMAALEFEPQARINFSSQPPLPIMSMSMPNMSMHMPMPNLSMMPMPNLSMMPTPNMPMPNLPMPLPNLLPLPFQMDLQANNHYSSSVKENHRINKPKSTTISRNLISIKKLSPSKQPTSTAEVIDLTFDSDS